MTIPYQGRGFRIQADAVGQPYAAAVGVRRIRRSDPNPAGSQPVDADGASLDQTPEKGSCARISLAVIPSKRWRLISSRVGARDASSFEPFLVSFRLNA